MRRTRRARRGSGFTLIELMIVVAMVGVLLGLAVYTLQNKPRPYDAAETTASLVRQAARKAVEGGSVRPDVAARLGTLARTRVLLTTTSDGLIDVAVEQLAEDPQPSDNGTWQLIAHKTLGRGVTLSGWSPRAELADGTSPDTTVGASDVVEIDCFADGSCQGMTIYLTGRSQRLARVAVLPLGGAPASFQVW